MPSEKTITKCSEARRSTKPIMEKRRRARINNSLAELKNLILDALKKDNARHSKLEKADILEMTVKHLQNLQMQRMTPDPNAMAKFRSGFTECANEVSRFFGQVDGVDPTIRQRLLNHLANCLNGMNSPPPTPLSPVHVQVGGSEADTAASAAATARLLGGVQLVPTRLPSGDIAFLLPAQLSVYAPSTVPISPAASTASSSSCSSPSPVNVLGSSGILSPAASDRCSPSPNLHTKLPESPIHACPPMAVPEKIESESVWRPW